MKQITDFFLKLFDHTDRFFLISNLVIWLAFFTLAILIFQRIAKTKETTFAIRPILLTGVLIACGTIFFLDAIMFWIPMYRLSVLVRLITALLSCITVFYLIKQLPPDFSNKNQHSLRNEIEQRRKAESDLLTASQKIEETEKQYANLITNLPTAFYTCDTKGRILMYNKAAVLLWGREPVIGKDLWCGSWKIFKADGTPMSHEECPMALTLKEKRPVLGEEIMIQREDGNMYYLLPYPSPLFNAAGELTGALNVLIDITERKNIYAKLVKTEMDIRNFAKQQNNLLEDERSRIAREIHDEFGQQLAGIKMSLSTLIRPGNPDINNPDMNASEMVRSMINEVDNTMQSLRKFATELRPGILDTLGLVASIEWLVEEFENKTGIRCQLHINVQEYYFEKALSTCFFRICQEALTNILKHARAGEVTIQISQHDNNLKLTIADNGEGINREKLDNPFSMGILGMRERANLVGARLSISSEKNSGTIIVLNAKFDGE